MCRNQPLQHSGERGREEGMKSVTSSPVTSSPPTRPRRNNISRIRLVVLGEEGVGKSALTVRYLTRRYISEYRRSIDLLYRHTVCLDDVTSDVEILDVSLREGGSVSAGQARWGEGFVVVYSVDNRDSFLGARHTLDALANLKAPLYVPVILLANKRDLDHARQVSVEDGQALSLAHGCQFYEVSAAESHVGVTLAFQALLRETRSLQQARPPPRQRRLSIVAVSRMIGSLIGRGSDPPSPTLKPTLTVHEPGKRRRKDKKRPSLSL